MHVYEKSSAVAAARPTYNAAQAKSSDVVEEDNDAPQAPAAEAKKALSRSDTLDLISSADTSNQWTVSTVTVSKTVSADVSSPSDGNKKEVAAVTAEKRSSNDSDESSAAAVVRASVSVEKDKTPLTRKGTVEDITNE